MKTERMDFLVFPTCLCLVVFLYSVLNLIEFLYSLLKKRSDIVQIKSPLTVVHIHACPLIQ